MFYIIIKTYIIILIIFSIRAVVPRAKIIELTEFFWKNILVFLLTYMFFLIYLCVLFVK